MAALGQKAAVASSNVSARASSAGEWRAQEQDVIHTSHGHQRSNFRCEILAPQAPALLPHRRARARMADRTRKAIFWNRARRLTHWRGAALVLRCAPRAH